MSRSKFCIQGHREDQCECPGALFYSAQLLWQTKQFIAGNCVTCGKPRGDSPFKRKCIACGKKTTQRARKKLRGKYWVPGGPGRPPLIRRKERSDKKRGKIGQVQLNETQAAPTV